MTGTGSFSTAGMLRQDMSLSQMGELLDATPWSSDFAWEEILQLSGFVDCVTVHGGEVVFHEHDEQACMFLVIEGEVRVVKEGPDRDPRTLVTLGPGKAFGEISLLDGRPRSASVVATRASTLFVLTQEKLRTLCSTRPRLGTILLWKLCRVVGGRLRETSGTLVEYLGE